MSLSKEKNKNQLTHLRASFLEARSASEKLETELNKLRTSAKKANSKNDENALEKINVEFVRKQAETERARETENERRALMKAFYLSGELLDWTIFARPGKLFDSLSQSWLDGIIALTETEITAAEQQIVGEIIRADVKLKSDKDAFRLQVEENFGSCWFDVSFGEILKRFREQGWISVDDASRLERAQSLEVLSEQGNREGENNL